MLTGKNIMIMVEQSYQVLEVWYPLLRFREEGANVQIVGSGTAAQYLSKEGYPIEVSAGAAKVDPQHYEAVVVPGGWAPDYMRRHRDMVSLVREIHRNGGIVGAICHGGSMLVSAGIVKGIRLTSFFSIRDDLVAAGAKWVDEPVVVDHRIVTSRNPDDLPLFVKAILKLLIT